MVTTPKNVWRCKRRADALWGRAGYEDCGFFWGILVTDAGKRDETISYTLHLSEVLICGVVGIYLFPKT